MASVAGGGGEEEREREGPLVYVLALPAAPPSVPVAVSLMDAAVPRKARSHLPRAKPSSWWSFRLSAPSPEEAKKRSEEARLRVLQPSAAKNPRPEGSVSDSPQDSPEPEAARDVYLLRTSTRRSTPRKEAKNPRPSITAKRACQHCGSSSTPLWREGPAGRGTLWREGPAGRGTLCNACGMRYRRRRLLPDPEHQPLASSTSAPSEHANVQRQHPLAQSVADADSLAAARASSNDDSADAAAGRGGGDGDGPDMGVASTLDPWLLDGPSAPLIVDDGDEFLIS